jgi:hypothetical protein
MAHYADDPRSKTQNATIAMYGIGSGAVRVFLSKQLFSMSMSSPQGLPSHQYCYRQLTLVTLV